MEEQNSNKAGLSVYDVVEELLTAEGEEMTPSTRRYIESQKMFVESLFAKMLSHIGEGKRVRIMNFGTFRQRIARGSVFDPNAGAEKDVSERVRLGFVPAKKTVKALNK